MDTASIVTLSAWGVYLVGFGQTAKSHYQELRTKKIEEDLAALKRNGTPITPYLVQDTARYYKAWNAGDHKVASFFFAMGWPVLRPIHWLFKNPAKTTAEKWAHAELVERDRDAELAELQRKIDQMAREAKR